MGRANSFVLAHGRSRSSLDVLLEDGAVPKSGKWTTLFNARNVEQQVEASTLLMLDGLGREDPNLQALANSDVGKQWEILRSKITSTIRSIDQEQGQQQQQQQQTQAPADSAVITVENQQTEAAAERRNLTPEYRHKRMVEEMERRNERRKVKARGPTAAEMKAASEAKKFKDQTERE